MKLVLQRVKCASVKISGDVYSEILKGILVLICIEKGDDKKVVEYYAEKISKLRIFADENDKMNLSIKDINGEVLAISQFTLAADCKKGTRPSFDKSAPSESAKILYEHFVQNLREREIEVKTGVFGAMMEVSLVNYGPVTFILE